jgi:aminoglycoside phosphotransferase (APT) family kinase protein
MVSPTMQDLRAIVREGLDAELVSARRFPTGNCHYVYDAVLGDGRSVVLRVAKPENRQLLVGALHWAGVLRPMGFPLPEIIHFRLTEGKTPFPYMVLERIEGKDLGEVYSGMSAMEKGALARELAGLQMKVGNLPEGAGFGFQSDPAVPPPFATWAGVVDGSIERSARWIEEAGVVDGKRVETLRDAVRGLKKYFDGIRPRPFLDDITTKNVLIHEGKLAGIVDVDEVCYGDRVAHLGLTRMALLGWELETDYIEYWCDALGLNKEQRRALDFYTAESCLCFLGEQGQRFNQDKTPEVDRARVERFEGIFDEMVAGVT